MDDAAPTSPPDSGFGLGPQVDPRLLEILVCPVTRGPLTYDPVAGELISKGARLAYPVRDGVPIMLPEDARELAEGE